MGLSALGERRRLPQISVWTPRYFFKALKKLSLFGLTDAKVILAKNRKMNTTLSVGRAMPEGLAYHANEKASCYHSEMPMQRQKSINIFMENGNHS